MRVLVQKLDGNAKLPEYAYPGDAGMDLFANEDAVLKPGERKLIKTGIKIAVPKGYEAQVRPKSGLAVNSGITLLNTPGTIDSTYRGEVCVILINLGEKPYKIERGKKIAQMVFSRVENAEISVVDSLDNTHRGEHGFGSTGNE